MELNGLRCRLWWIRQPGHDPVGDKINREGLSGDRVSFGRDPDGPEIKGIKKDIKGLADEEDAGLEELAFDGKGAVLFDLASDPGEEDAIEIHRIGDGPDGIG